MIVLDFSQIAHSNVAVLARENSARIDEGMLRHMILNTIRTNLNKFKNTYGDLVIAFDSDRYWRKDIFRYYKAGRAEGREDSLLNWSEIHVTLKVIKREIEEFFPYVCLEVDGAEADDIIAVIAKRQPIMSDDSHKVLIISRDADFVQLLQENSVEIYDPIGKRFIEHGDPDRQLFEKICKGDPGDGIPNILSRADYYVTRTRGDKQKPMTVKRMNAIADYDVNDWKANIEVARAFHRNEQLIDLNFIPEEVTGMIWDAYQARCHRPPRSKSKLMDYFISRKLRNLYEHIGEF